MPQGTLIRRLGTNVRKPSAWLLIFLFLFMTFLQYAAYSRQPAFLANLTPDLGLTRYTVERILFLLPITWAGFSFGWKGGAITSLAAVGCMLPRALYDSPVREDALVETGMVFLVGNLISYSLELLRKERIRRAQLETAQRELQFFLKHVTTAQEEERKRIAWELHDDTIQSLVVLCQNIDDLSSNIKRLPQQAKLRLDELHQQANTIMQEVRRLSQDLRPAALDNLGLVSALEWLVSDVAKHSGIEANFKVIGKERKFATEVDLVIFRIAQEALRNVWKHAQAKSAQVTLSFTEGKTYLAISDNGIGFAHLQINVLPGLGKLGLAGMQERAHFLGGNLSIISESGKGTTITAEFPI